MGKHEIKSAEVANYVLLVYREAPGRAYDVWMRYLDQATCTAELYNMQNKLSEYGLNGIGPRYMKINYEIIKVPPQFKCGKENQNG